MDSDYVLLFILIIIVIITGMLLTFIGVICFCSRLKKKQYNKNVKSFNKNVSELDELADLADTNHYILAKSSLAIGKNSRQKTKKPNKSKQPDLNSSNASSSSTSQDKTHYTLVHDKNTSSSSASSATHTGTILYRDDHDDDDFGIISASVCPIRQFSSRDKNHATFSQQQHHQLKFQQSHPRYIYSSTTMATCDHNTSSFDESNSNPESVIDTTTIDDSKSSSLNNEYESNNPLSVIKNTNTAKRSKMNYTQIKTKNETSSSVSSASSNHSSSSAYSSISTSENGAGLDSDTNKVI